MKAVYRLNEEKLEFNYRVLKEREKVNKQTLDNLKKRERKYREVLRTVKTKFQSQHKSFANNNKLMTKDYKKFTKEFLLLQKKYERFEKSDKNRFNEIWSMNQNEVSALCEKIKNCDKMIHVQQLGIAWQPPTDPIFKQDGASAAGAGQTGGQSLIGGQNTSVMDSSKHGMSKSEFVDDGQMSNSTGRGGGENQDIKDNFHKVKNVFEILINEAPFLIDEKAQIMSEGKSKKD